VSINSASRIERITMALAILEPSHLEVIDDSARHAGHAGAATGLGHFNLVIASAQFIGMNAITRHRAVYQALGTLMQSDIHALSIQARLPDEVSR
jgi:BolA family transcriptional regulator, general stress-responsive regulator